MTKSNNLGTILVLAILAVAAGTWLMRVIVANKHIDVTPPVVVQITPPPPAPPSIGEGPSPNQPQPILEPAPEPAPEPVPVPVAPPEPAPPPVVVHKPPVVVHKPKPRCKCHVKKLVPFVPVINDPFRRQGW